MICIHCDHGYIVQEGEDNGPCPSCGQNPTLQLDAITENKSFPSG